MTSGCYNRLALAKKIESLVLGTNRIYSNERSRTGKYSCKFIAIVGKVHALAWPIYNRDRL